MVDLEVTSGAQQRFEQADWHAVQQAMKTVSIFTIITLVWSWSNCAALLTAESTDAAFLLRVKEHYTRLLPDYLRFEIGGEL